MNTGDPGVGITLKLNLMVFPTPSCLQISLEMGEVTITHQYNCFNEELCNYSLNAIRKQGGASQ